MIGRYLSRNDLHIRDSLDLVGIHDLDGSRHPNFHLQASFLTLGSKTQDSFIGLAFTNTSPKLTRYRVSGTIFRRFSEILTINKVKRGL